MKHITISLIFAISVCAFKVQGQQAVNTDIVESVNDLTDLAIFAANKVLPKNTFYTYAVHPENNRNKLINLLAPQPFVFSDCSGWVSYALDSLADEAYAPIHEARNKSKFYPQAYKYYKYFSELSSGNTQWTAGTDLKDMQDGSILSWCEGDWCNDKSDDRYSNTGHIVIVLKSNKLSITKKSKSGKQELKQRLTGHLNTGGNEVEIYELWVVDDSSVKHGSKSLVNTKKQPVQDKRNQCTIDICLASEVYKGINTHGMKTGGLGAGIIYVAQWSQNGKTHYARLFDRDSPDHNWNDSDQTLRMAWGIPKKFSKEK